MPSILSSDGPVVLDGGTGRELLKRRVPILTHIWASTALIIAPDIVRQIHLDFITAGADVITTNTYGVVRDSVAKEGLEERYKELNITAARLAAEARDASGKDVAIAGGLPPLSRSYRPDLINSDERLLVLYREQAEILAPLVDVFICETMSAGREALAAAAAALETGRPVWVAWTLDDDNSGRLRSGETVSEAAQLLDHLAVDGFLCNCCSPESIDAATPELKRIGRGRWGGYPNTFLPVDTSGLNYGERKLDPSDWERYQAAALPFRQDLPPQVFAEHARSWLHDGAKILGGCCGAGPEYIAQLRSVVDTDQGSIERTRRS